MKNYLLLIAIAIGINGCVSTHSGLLQPSNVQLNNPNFKIIKTVDGFATATYVFGFGGYNRDGLIKEAKRHMYNNHRFLQNQMITNVTLDEKKSWIFAPIIYKKTIILSADIIQFGDITTRNLNIDTTSNKYGAEVEKQGAEIKELINDERIIINLTNSSEVELINYSTINEVKIGDFVKIENPYSQNVFGKVASISSNKLVRVKLFPSPGTEIFDEINFKKILKVKR